MPCLGNCCQFVEGLLNSDQISWNIAKTAIFITMTLHDIFDHCVVFVCIFFQIPIWTIHKYSAVHEKQNNGLHSLSSYFSSFIWPMHAHNGCTGGRNFPLSSTTVSCFDFWSIYLLSLSNDVYYTYSLLEAVGLYYFWRNILISEHLFLSYSNSGFLKRPAVEEILIIQNFFFKFFGPRMFIRS